MSNLYKKFIYLCHVQIILSVNNFHSLMSSIGNKKRRNLITNEKERKKEDGEISPHHKVLKLTRKR